MSIVNVDMNIDVDMDFDVDLDVVCRTMLVECAAFPMVLTIR